MEPRKANRSSGREQKRSRGLAPVYLYLHLPFCKSRCGYCNFYSTTDLSLLDAFTDAMVRAIETSPLTGRKAVSVYFGGGTPSLLGDRLLVLLEAVRARLPLSPDVEITLEANPGTLEAGLLERLRRGGFNRISFGWQAGSDDRLRQLGRIHTAAEGREAVEAARAAGFESISVDIMLGTPGQTEDELRALCQRIVQLDVPHISAYMLKIEPGTPFAAQGMEALCPNPDQTADLYLAACKEFANGGYSHYEISNFSKPGYESRHNSAYWQLQDYLGIGPAAYSFLEGKRFHFPPDLGAFLQAENPWRTVAADGDGGGWEEYLMLALRLREGLSLEDFSCRYGVDPVKLAARARPLAAQGLLLLEQDCIALTDQGFLVSNSVINFLSDGVFARLPGEC